MYASDLRAGLDKGRPHYEPAVTELLGDVRGQRVLDVGCGEGCWCRRLCELGADVTGIDGSEEMIRLAVEAGAPASCEFLVADLTQPLPLPECAFNAVLSNMVLMDLPSIDVAVSEFARVLEPGGQLIFSITHPCFFPFEWTRDETGQKLYKAVRDYQTPKQINMNFWGETAHYHRPLSDYFSALESAALAIDALRELPMSDEDGIPSFLVVRARRMFA